MQANFKVGNHWKNDYINDGIYECTNNCFGQIELLKLISTTVN